MNSIISANLKSSSTDRPTTPDCAFVANNIHIKFSFINCRRRSSSFPPRLRARNPTNDCVRLKWCWRVIHSVQLYSSSAAAADESPKRNVENRKREIETVNFRPITFQVFVAGHFQPQPYQMSE